MTPDSPVRYGERDARLPAWGPYSKRYAGISHVADPATGARLDLTIVPAFFRGGMVVADGLRPSGFHPWAASPGLRHYTYRYELEWQDRIYCDVSFTELSARARLITCDYVNTTGAPYRVATHAVTSLDFPRISAHGEWLRAVTPELAHGVNWVDGLDYRELGFAHRRRDAGLVADGLLTGERRAHGAVGGSVLGQGFGRDGGDRADYPVYVAEQLSGAIIRLRHRLPRGAVAALSISGGLAEANLQLTGTGAMATVDLGVGDVRPGEYRLTVTTRGAAGLDAHGAELEIDGFLVGEPAAVDAVAFRAADHSTEVEVWPGPGGGFLLDHAALPATYGLAWSVAGAEHREFVGEDLDMVLKSAKIDHHGMPRQSDVSEAHESAQQVRFTDVLTAPALLEGRSRTRMHALVCHGTAQQVAEDLAGFAGMDEAERSRRHAEGARLVVDFQENPAGRRHASAQHRMAATLLTNVVYPTYVRRSHIRHFTPGRWWDSLYTWDSGFIGLGLAEVDPARAEDCLTTYLTGPDDPHSAFIHHGSPVPTQQYLAAELLSREPRSEKAAQWYPGLRAQYRFLAGHCPESRTRLPSGLLNTFGHFYNSGGWDDLPAQAHTHAHRLARSVAPMVTVSHAIRTAKLLWLTAAGLAGVPVDETAGYRADIAGFSAALQACWDPETGYFGYATHGEDGRTTGLLRDENGVNLNMSLDGVSPLIAGAASPDQVSTLLDRLFCPERMWTDIGISSVDQSAPYFSLDGYWNGSVWMPHQWFLFKAMLDLGRPELAHRIAATAVELWTAESERTYHSWEHFQVATGRGGGWHQFGALSSPVLNFFTAYHRPGSLTAGLDTRITERTANAGKTELTAQLLSVPNAGGDRASLIACLAPGRRYQGWIDGVPVASEQVADGVLHLSWLNAGDPVSLQQRTITVRPA